MKHPLTLFRRLVLGMVITSLLAIAASGAFLYVRFEATNTIFREDTLRTFAQSMTRELVAAGDGLPKTIATGRKIEKAGGAFAIVEDGGRVLAASRSVDTPFVPPDSADERYFALPNPASGGPLYGLSVRVADTSPPLYIQVAFPPSHVLYDSLLEEFVVDIAWIWLPFIVCILATNVIVARVALRPLREAVHQAEAIGPGSVAARIVEGRLPRDVLTLVQAINRALARLQRGYEALEEFTADVAHELRTPLAVIKTRLAVTAAPIAGELNRDLESLERLVQQLLDRVKLGGMHFEPTDVLDLCAVARKVGCFLAPLVIERQRSIEVIAPETPVFVSGAEDYVFRALRNLVENAVAHTPAGGVVSVCVLADGSIRVRDAGPGFPPERLDPERRRSARLRSDRSGGVGLGLWIAEQTMLAHQGRLDLENHLEGGAVAILRFPPSPKDLAAAIP